MKTPNAMEARWLMFFLSVLNGSSPASVHGQMYMWVGTKDVEAMTKEGLILCDHPEEWGGEMAWPAPAMTITEAGKQWLSDHSRLVELKRTERVLATEPDPANERAGYWG